MIVNLVKNAIEAIDDLAASGRRKEPPRIQIRACVEGKLRLLSYKGRSHRHIRLSTIQRNSPYIDEIA